MFATKVIKLKGGFHDACEISLRINAEYPVNKLQTSELVDALSEKQIKRLESHFCGINGCECGSWTRAKII